MNSRNPYTHMRAGAILCTVYVILGAFGAHGLESKLTVAQLATYHTGLRYLIVHAIALILTNHTDDDTIQIMSVLCLSISEMFSRS